MGRPNKLLNDDQMDKLLSMIDDGNTMDVMATELGISEPTLTRRIADIQKKTGILMQYRAIQSLQLTEIQARILEAITPEKINEAPLDILVKAFKILKDKETDIDEGRVGEVKGLVAYLIELEKRELALGDKPEGPSEIDITPKPPESSEFDVSRFPVIN